MPIKIKSSGGGSVSFDVGNIGSDFTLTAPANNATIFTTAGGTISGNVAFTGNNVSIGGQTISPAVGMRNRIINGAMVIDQRNVGASVNPDNQYIIDRWFAVNNVLNKFTVQQNAGSVTPPTGFTHYLGCTSSSSYSVGSGEYFIVGQRIEGFNFADMMWGTANAKTITISFWVRSSLTGTFGGFLRNNANNRFYPFSYSISSANTWTYISITISGDTTGTWVGATNGVGLDLNFNIGLGSTYTGSPNAWTASAILGPTGAQSVVGTSGATWYITGVQVEAGSVATPFEFRHYTTELQLCQRYYIKPNDVFSGVGQGGVAYFYCFNTNEASGNNVFPVQMRAAPTITYYDNNNNAGSAHRLGVGDVSSVNAGWINKNAWAFLGKSSGWSAGNLLGCAWQANAEL